MFNETEHKLISKQYFELLNARSTKSKIIWTPIFIIFTGMMIGLLFIPDFLEREPWNWLYPIYGGLIFIGLLIAIFVSYLGISEKPAFHYLYKEVYDKINLENRTFYSYSSYEKITPEFNQYGGLFSRYCRAEIKRHVSGVLKSGNNFDIYDLLLITGSGKNRQVHLNGIYFVIKNNFSSLLQVRTKGRPHKKGVKYNKIDKINDIKVFNEEGKMLSSIDYNYVRFVKELKANLGLKKLYLSVIADEIHLAYEPIAKVRKQRHLPIEKLNEIYDYFVNEINIIEEVVSTNNY